MTRRRKASAPSPAEVARAQAKFLLLDRHLRGATAGYCGDSDQKAEKHRRIGRLLSRWNRPSGSADEWGGA